MATPLNRTDRYIAPGVTKTYMLPVVATLGLVTRVEINQAGSWDLTGEIAAATGWEIKSNRVPTPDMGTPFTGRADGRTEPGDAQITFYASRDTNDVRQILQRGDRHVIYIADGGDVPGQLARAFRVSISAVTPTYDVGGTEATRIMVDYSISQVEERLIIPALS